MKKTSNSNFTGKKEIQESEGELPVGVQMLTAASIPAMLMGTLVVGIEQLSTEPASAGDDGNGSVVVVASTTTTTSSATVVAPPAGARSMKPGEAVAQVADASSSSSSSMDFDLKQVLIEASQSAPATESSEAKEKAARDKKQKAADAKAVAEKKRAEAKVVAEAKKREAAQRKAAVMPKQNSESAKERAQRAREITQAKIEADKAAKAKMQAANQAKVEARKQAQSSSIGQPRESEKDKIARVNAQLKKKPEAAKPKPVTTETPAPVAPAPSPVVEAKKPAAAAFKMPSMPKISTPSAPKLTFDASAAKAKRDAENAKKAEDAKKKASTPVVVATPAPATPSTGGLSAPVLGNKKATKSPPPPPASTTDIEKAKEAEKKQLEDALEAKLQAVRAQKGKKVETTTTTPAIVKRASLAASAPVKPATPTKSAPAPAPKVVEKKIETPKPVVAPSSSTSGDDFSIDFGSFFSEYMQSTPAPMKKVEAPKPVVVETPKPVVVETPKPVVIEAPKPVVAAPSSSSSDDLSIDFGSFFSQYMESSPAPVKKEKKEKAPAPSKKVSAKPSSSAEKRKLGLGKANFSNMPRSAPKLKKERKVVEKVKPTYTFQRTGPADKEGFKSADRPYLKSTAPTKKQSLVTAIAGGVGVLISFVATRDPKYKNGQIDISKTSDGKVDFPERTFEKKKWGGDGVTKTPAPRKKLFAKKETTTTAPKTTTATASVSVVDNAADAGKWIDAWKKNSTTGGGGDSSSADSEASKWIEGWSQWSKDQVGGDATAPTEATADGRDSAEKWIAQWKADGSPTDESRKGDAKKWIDDWKNKTN